ncbi:MAG: alpha/beta fold hydrolase [Pseudomonadota bacterium]
MSRLNFETHGDAQQPAVLLLHGFMSCNGQWLANLEALSEHLFLITVELWGHGDSPMPSDAGQFSLPSYYEQFEQIRAELGVTTWAVIGQSYGAGIVLNYARAFPEVCTAAVATNSRSAFGTMLEERERSGEANAAPPEDLRKLPFHPIHARRFPPAIKDVLVAKADDMLPEAVRLSGRLGRDLNCRDKLADLPVPLLITNGKYEKSFQRDLQTLREAIPELNVVDLEGGHSVNIEAAEGFNETVLRFLR